MGASLNWLPRTDKASQLEQAAKPARLILGDMGPARHLPLSAMGHSPTWAGDALMSEKCSEPDIKPRRANVAEVPKADPTTGEMLSRLDLRHPAPAEADAQC